MADAGEVAIRYGGQEVLIKCPLFGQGCRFIPDSAPRGNGLRSLKQHLSADDHQQYLSDRGYERPLRLGFEDVIQLCGRQRQPDGLYAGLHPVRSQADQDQQDDQYQLGPPHTNLAWVPLFNLTNQVRIYFFLAALLFLSGCAAWILNHRNTYHIQQWYRVQDAVSIWRDNRCDEPTLLNQAMCRELTGLKDGQYPGYMSANGLGKDLNIWINLVPLKAFVYWTMGFCTFILSYRWIAH